MKMDQKSGWVGQYQNIYIILTWHKQGSHLDTLGWTQLLRTDEPRWPKNGATFFSKSSIQCLNSLLVHVQRLQAVEGEWKPSPDLQKCIFFAWAKKEWQPNWLFRGTRLDRSNKKCNDCLFGEKCHWLNSHLIERSNETDRSHSQFCHVFA